MHMFKQCNQRKLYWLILSALVIMLDQATKWLVVANVSKAISVTPFFNLVIAWNTGVSFSLFNGMGDVGAYLLIAMALIITLLFLYWLLQAARPLHALSYSLVIGGALGNVIDRARFGAVIDFLDFHAFGYHWPAFNVADMAVVTGISLLILLSLFFDFKHK